MSDEPMEIPVPILRARPPGAPLFPILFPPPPPAHHESVVPEDGRDCWVCGEPMEPGAECRMGRVDTGRPGFSFGYWHTTCDHDYYRGVR